MDFESLNRKFERMIYIPYFCIRFRKDNITVSNKIKICMSDEMFACLKRICCMNTKEVGFGIFTDS